MHLREKNLTCRGSGSYSSFLSATRAQGEARQRLLQRKGKKKMRDRKRSEQESDWQRLLMLFAGERSRQAHTPSHKHTPSQPAHCLTYRLPHLRFEWAHTLQPSLCLHCIGEGCMGGGRGREGWHVWAKVCVCLYECVCMCVCQSH